MSLPAPSPSTTAVVTGASSGIGADLARELARRGHGITLVARREDRLRALAAELSDVRVEVVAADVADPRQRQALWDALADRGLVVDVLVNNAGIGTMGAVSRSSVDAEVAQVRLNCEALLDLTTRAVLEMVPRGRGAILNVGSTASYNPFPGQAAYAATKAFVHTYTEGLRAELHGTGVTATVLAPGPVKTEFLEVAGMDGKSFSASFPKVLWETSADVARAGIDGLDAGRAVVIPGAAVRVGAELTKRLPRRVLLPVLRARHPALKRP